MGFKEQAFTLLTEQALGAAVGAVPLLVTSGAKLLWQGIKRFFKGKEDELPPETCVVVERNNSGDQVSASSLKNILSMIPDEVLLKLIEKATSGNSGNTEIHGDNYASASIAGGNFAGAAISGGDFAGASISGPVTVYKGTPAPPPHDYYAEAMRFFEHGQRDKAFVAFDKAIEQNSDNSEVYFYAAICLLRGKIPFVTLRPEIDKIETYLDTALTIEQKAIYFYFQAYIKYDYYERKCFNTSPTSRQAMLQAKRAGLTSLDVQQLRKLLNIKAFPACLQIS